MIAPPRVQPEEYWATEPPQRSARCSWWEARIRAGWRRNRRLRSLGYHESAEYFGVYIWEWLNVLSPMLSADERLADLP